MLRKVVSGAAGAAKDKLKQRRQQGHSSTSSRRSNHGRSSTNAIVSLSAVDNAAFEDILNDDSDFFVDADGHTPSSGPAVPPLGTSPSKTESLLPGGPLNSDLFDDNMFRAKDKEREESDEVKGDTVMNCDPLSGQILSTPETTEAFDKQSLTNSHEEMSGIAEMEGKNEVEISGKESPANNREEMSSIAEAEDKSGLETSWNGVVELNQERADVSKDLRDGGENELESGHCRDQQSADLDKSQNKLLEELVDDDRLFNDDVPPPSKPIPISTSSDVTPAPLITDESTHKRELSMNSESGLSVAMSDSSYLNSFPSSLETELVKAIHSQGVSGDHEPESSSRPDSPPLFSLDMKNAPIEEMPSQSRTIARATDREKEPLDGPTDVESELEMLLASPRRVPVDMTQEEVVKKEQGGLAQVGGSLEKGGHLDSGVFDPVVLDSEGTPEKDREQARILLTANAPPDDEILAVKTDYFSSSPALKRPQSNTGSLKSSDSQTSLPQASENAHSNLSTSRQSKPRPPRPPPPSPSPGMARKTKINQTSHDSKKASTSSHDSPHQSTFIRKSTAAERLLNDELFPDDIKKTQELSMPNSEGSGTRDVRLLASSRQTSEKSLVNLQESLNGSTLASEGSVKEVSENEFCDCKEKLSSESEVSLSERQESQFHLTWEYHCILAFLLYLYYSLNVFPYLAGLFAGFFTLFLCLGSVFIYYVHFIEAETKTKKEKARRVTLSDDFVQTMGVDFSDLGKYESNKFTAVLAYDHSTHHPKERMYTELKLQDSFKFHIDVWDDLTTQHSAVFDMVDIRQCKVTLEPPEVAQNRKRRWSKKFPIVVTCEKPNPAPRRLTTVYLFSPTARLKEDWFRRFRHAADGISTEKLIQQQKVFFGYMEKYFPDEMLRNISLFPNQRVVKKPLSNRSSSSKKGNHQKKLDDTRVQFSKGMDTDQLSDDTELSTGVNISHRDIGWSNNSSTNCRTVSPQSSSTHLKAATPPSRKRYAPAPPPRPRSPVHIRRDCDFDIVDYPLPNEGGMSQHGLPFPNSVDLWLNSLAARLCWDVWHEQRWKDWIMTRIQKKLFKTKTPSFMEKLQLIDVDIGMDMPVVKRRVGGPRLDLQGIWIYLDVTYQGKFVMTIETKMKFKNNNSADEKGTEKEGRQMTAISSKNRSSRTGVPVDSPVAGTSGDGMKTRSMSHSRAARALGGGGKVMGGDEADEEDEIDSGSDDDEQRVTHPLMEEELVEARESLDHHSDTSSSELPPGVPMTVATGNKGKLKSMMYNVAKRMANTKIVQRAKEKVSSYPLVLTVEVIKLDGVLAVNIPPPQTDTIWWGFHENPKLELVAKPRLGHREVKLSKVTHWIERKLCDIVNKKLVLPEMEDLVIPLLNSGMAEDKLRPIPADSSGSNVSAAHVS